MRPANLMEFKEKQGIQGIELAKRLGITAAHLSMILNGKRTPSRKLALKISQQTGIPVINLLFPAN
jgi:transcriptional regulator with XRE-family HTH domain